MPTPLAPCPPDEPRYVQRRGKKRPRGIAWFGFSSFWGHLRHLLAAAIATDNVDSRQWMIPDIPGELLGRAIAVLRGRGAKDAGTLAGALGGEVWIDFVSDCGDDVTVSESVARLLVAEYELEGTLLPRGHVLILGGDLAYPVATVRELTRRLVDPWNRVFSADVGPPRVLLAIPGNHDWYDGLDGFARLCASPCTFEEPDLAEDALHPQPDEHPVLAWAEAFVSGERVKKPGTMAFAGYMAVQRASYFRLPLAKGLELCGVDRQLRGIDPRQKAYFAVRRGKDARLLLLPDPARAWGELRPNGVATLAALEIDPAATSTLILAGDVHHYERSREGKSLHVVAGGGGAFLQGARIAGEAAYDREVEFPGPKKSLAMLRSLPWQLAIGRAGWVITSIFALANAVVIGQDFGGALTAAVVYGIVVAIGTALLVGWRRFRWYRVIPVTVLFGLFLGAMPLGIDWMLQFTHVHTVIASTMAVAVATFFSGVFFGAMLMIIGRLGYNHAQPFAALGDTGYKHFVRLRVQERPEGPRVDAWVIGMIDPVTGSEPVLVDRFTWEPRG